ncbi:RagB/SusD family nutrient uptake outer membrane protein [Flavivirga amylovorans]|uniref:RagB/SusD family nutrient uptake outer membrane protein n=1 Tax=Flavivirga amylovorans TaxID=870486 RepID=A0ABT8X7E2_9FLAO|nr:RagB/SusD family nutrient uptake outer membrane protein [Flavivirga amylovorans]MDO5989603.1 RagB/SusD family nutrient uptake outer membrane protein [Flavivirga amylovorans]
MKKYNLIKISVITLVLALVSCDDILDESPDNRTEIDSLEKISELLVNAYPQALYTPFLEPMSDNADDKSFSADQTRLNDLMYEWSNFFDDDEDTPTFYWNEAYEAISQANQALASLDELGQVDVVQRGEALIARAYAHFMLVNIFAKAYNPSTASTDLGIPYITEPEITLLPQYERNTLQEVYDSIEADLVEGLKYTGNDNDYQDARIAKFHFTSKAANAFASRFYLVIGEWQKVIDHSNKVLSGSGINDLRDYANEYRGAGLSYSERAFRFSSTIEPANLLITVGSSVYNRNHFSLRFQLSGDLARELFFNGNAAGLAWSEQVFGQDLFFNVPKYDEYFRTTNQAAGIGLPFVQTPILTTDETLFNRAEAYAMLGEFQLAADDLNTLLSVKSEGYTSAAVLSTDDITANFGADSNFYTPFYQIPADALPFVNVILETKRSVFYNEGLRWFDVKRHDIVVEHERQVTPSVTETLTLPKGDNRRALQIPTEAQSRGILPNPR